MDVFNNSTKVYSFSDQPPTTAHLYTIQPGSELLISSVTITATQPYQNTTVLNLCEVEIFGDSSCLEDKPTGTYRYGRDCENVCNCAVEGQKCFVSTGNCPSGCQAGLYGEGCNTACRPTFYGVDCVNRCNDTCKDQLCDKVNGHCIHCATPGKRPPLCVEDCNQGFYGVDCTMNCSRNCMEGNCNVINGTCFDCVPGFYGIHCNTSCPSACENSVCGRYSGHCKSCSPGFYGINCKTSCPENCHETGCDFLSGSCTSCQDGFQGSRCEEECTGNTYGENCALNCNIHCNNTLDTLRTCKNTDGSCLYGCISGFHGSDCNIRTSPSDSAGEYDRGFAIGVGVGIGVTVAADIIICIVVYFCTKRFKNQPAKKVETTDRNYDRVDSIQQNEHPYYTVDKSGDGYDLVQDVVSVNKKTNSVVTEAGKES